MAQGGLAHAEPPARSRHAALSKQAVEHHEQVEVEGAPIHLTHLYVTTMNLPHYSPPRSVGVGQSNEPFANGGSAMIDWIHAGPSVTAAFLGSLVECVEAVTIVLAVGMVRGWRSALLGAAAGPAVAVALAALVLRRPLTRVPENTLKLSVGVLIGGFGAFWMGEGLGVRWPGGDLAILGLAMVFLTMSLLITAILRRARTNNAAGRPAAFGGGRA